jgi:hypothetical protein
VLATVAAQEVGATAGVVVLDAGAEAVATLVAERAVVDEQPVRLIARSAPMHPASRRLKRERGLLERLIAQA